MRARLFENLVESGLVAGRAAPLRAVPLSVAIHATLLTAVAVGPLMMSPAAIPEPARAVKDIIFTVPSILPAPAPPSVGDAGAGTARSRVTRRFLPVLDASETATHTETAAEPPTDGAALTESLGTGFSFPDMEGTFGDRDGTSVAPSTPVRVGHQVKEPRKLKHVAPDYPEIARAARVQGVVVLECVIDEQGRVREIRILRGLPLLDQAAIDAVKKWVYTPTLLNGVPVPVVMTVTVNFRLSRGKAAA